jgi:DNA polymerase-3 subunit gamma/tau
MIVKLCGTREVAGRRLRRGVRAAPGQAAAVDSVVLAQLFDRFTRVVDALPRTRVPRLVLEMGLLDLVHSEPLMPLGDLIDRLEQISSARRTHRGRTTPAGAIRRSRPSKRLGLPRSPAPKRGRSPVPLQPLLRLKRPKIAGLDAPARRNRRPRA